MLRPRQRMDVTSIAQGTKMMKIMKENNLFPFCNFH